MRLSSLVWVQWYFLVLFIFEHVKKKIHDMVREDATRQSMWHTMDSFFGYFGNKIASPVIMAGRGVALAGNKLRQVGRQVGVWLYVVKAEVVLHETPEDERMSQWIPVLRSLPFGGHDCSLVVD